MEAVWSWQLACINGSFPFFGIPAVILVSLTRAADYLDLWLQQQWGGEMIQNALPLSRNRRKELQSLPWTSALHLTMNLPPLSIMQQKVSLPMWSEATDHLVIWIADAWVGQNTVRCLLRKIRQILQRDTGCRLSSLSPFSFWELGTCFN